LKPVRRHVGACVPPKEAICPYCGAPPEYAYDNNGGRGALLAQHWFAQHGINFDVTQVIGLTNDDPVSKEFRPLKQIIERLNRTFKGNYRPTTGFGSEPGAVSSVTLFVAYFNFLRPHSALDGNVPAIIPELDSLPNMPAKWLRLIAMSEDFIKSHAA